MKVTLLGTPPGGRDMIQKIQKKNPPWGDVHRVKKEKWGETRKRGMGES